MRNASPRTPCSSAFGGDDQLGLVARHFQYVAMGFRAGQRETWHARLAGAKNLAFAAQLQVLLGNAEAVLGLAQHFQPAVRGVAERLAVERECSLTPPRHGRRGREADAIVPDRSARRARRS